MVKRISPLASNEKFQVRFLVELLGRPTKWTTCSPFKEYEGILVLVGSTPTWK